ncbi:MAG: SCP2 sterol-binding domain-containing protein [Gemmatimonadales bacterium]
MAYRFLSADWLVAFKAAINSNAGYARAGRKWTHGPVALIVHAEPTFGLEAATCVWLNLQRGKCHDAQFVDVPEAQTAPFCIAADYTQWKRVVLNQLDPIRAIMQGKLKLKGKLAILVRFVRASEELVKCVGTVPTEFPDERRD